MTPPRNRRKKKGRIRIDRLLILLSPLLLLLLGVAGFFGMKYINPLTLKSREYVVEYKSEDYSPLDNVKSLYFGNKNDIHVTGSANPDKIGEYQMSYTWKDKEYPFTIKVEDTKGPSLEVQDFTADTVSDVSAENFIKSVSDASKYTVSLDSTNDAKKAGTYNITVTATDDAGNTTSKQCKLTRIQDTKAPVIDGFTDTLSVKQGNNLWLKNLKATDDTDPDPSISVNSDAVDMNTPGDYDIYYTVTDRSGNKTEYTQTVTVEPNPDYGKKIAYFTFDDGPSENTLDVLDELDKYNAKATFFVTGANPEYYDLMKEIVDRGHTIALHTYTHDYGKIYSSVDAYFDDLQKISDLVEQETGVVADCIRFPGGSSNTVSEDYSDGIMTTLTQEVQDRGYQYFDWNADSTDASGINIPAATIASNAESYIGMDEVNILFHDANGKETTVEALPEILKAYADAGYIFRGVSVDSFAPHHGVNN